MVPDFEPCEYTEDEGNKRIGRKLLFESKKRIVINECVDDDGDNAMNSARKDVVGGRCTYDNIRYEENPLEFVPS